MNEQKWWKHKAPLIVSTAFFIITLYMGFWTWSKIFSITLSVHRDTDVALGQLLFGADRDVPIVLVILFSVIAGVGWLVSTRVTFYQSRVWRCVYFFTSLLTVWGVIAAYGMWKSERNIIPFFESRLGNVIETNSFFERVVFEQSQSFYLMLTLLPLIVLFYVTLFMMGRFLRHDGELVKSFYEYEWTGKWQQKFSKMELTETWPDIQLGENSKTKEMVTMPGRDRTLNTAIIGAIGTGKTAALGLPMINQDLHHMVDYITDYPKIYQREDFRTEEVGGRYMNGLSVIEPSNDLCQQTFELVKAHGIPDEAITYIDPTNPNTPSINPMRGPVDKVAEVFAQVIAGLNDSKDGGNFFFEQAQRSHLKQYIYLLKLHDPDKQVTLDMLLDMYNNPQLVREMHVKLKTTFPENYEELEDRDERNYWKIVQGIDEWFDLNLLPKKTRVGQTEVPERDSEGNELYFDAKEEHVQGLRNILNDIGANPLIRRVLFGESEFDFDRHLEIGGILLVNTAKGELVKLAGVLGKIVLMNLQNATFRRPPKVSSFHHILVDEAPDYLYNAFREFPAQSRKYKVIITTLMQTIAQLADQFGDLYMTTLIAGMRNRMVYGDVPGYDAKYFSDMFGEKEVYDEGQNEMSVSPLQEDPMSRSGSSYAKVREQNMTASDIMYQDAFQCAVKIVVGNQPMPAVHINANFVDREEFNVAKVIADEEDLDVWLEQRRLFGTMPNTLGEQKILSVEETEVENAKYYDDAPPAIEEVEDEENVKVEIEENNHMIEKAINVPVDPHPRNPVVYQNVPPVSQKEQRKRQVEQPSSMVQSEKAMENVPTRTAKTNPVGTKTAESSQAHSQNDAGSGISELYESYDEGGDKTDEAVATAIKPVDAVDVKEKGGYQESEIPKETRVFFDKIGLEVESYEDMD